MKKMKYFVRSVKHLLWFVAIFALIVSIVVLIMDQFSFYTIFHPTEGMFREGSLYKIIIFLVAVAAIYPAVTYVKKESFITGSYEEKTDIILKTLYSYGYTVSDEDEQTITLQFRKPFLRFMRLYEDSITVTTGTSPLTITGPRKDITRLASALEYATKEDKE